MRLQQARFALTLPEAKHRVSGQPAWIYLVIAIGTAQSLYRKAQMAVLAVHPHCRNTAVSPGAGWWVAVAVAGATGHRKPEGPIARARARQ
jgi:hypothetical protein